MSRLLFLLLPLLALAAGPLPAPVGGQEPTPTATPAAAPAENPQPFQAWLADFMTEARSRGYSDALLEQTVAGLEEPLPQVIQSDRNQAELNPGFNRYLEARMTRAMLTRGREVGRANATALGRIEKTYNVQRRFLLAIWGVESRFGRSMGRTPVFRALATLAWEPRRSDFFRNELYHALMMVDRGYIDAPSMTGSWAGAMGQTQFMPSSYLAHAQDYDGDGRRDIWNTLPDVFASIANYMTAYGWKSDQIWGREVRVPKGGATRLAASVGFRQSGCRAERELTVAIPLAKWQSLGVRTTAGRALPKVNRSASLLRAGSKNYLVYGNYDALLGYNCAHSYALAVGLLSDRLD